MERVNSNHRRAKYRPLHGGVFCIKGRQGVLIDNDAKTTIFVVKDGMCNDFVADIADKQTLIDFYLRYF